MKTADEFRLFLDAAAATGDITNAARSMGRNRVTPTRWLAESRAVGKVQPEGERSSSQFFLEYPLGSGHWGFLHEHYREIERSLVETAQQSILHRAAHGTLEYARVNGRRVPCLNMDLIELGFTEAEAIMRDPVTGEVEYEMIRREPPVDLALAVLGAYTKRFNKAKTVSVSHNFNGGVTVAHSLGSSPRASLPVLEVVEPVATAAVDATMVPELTGEDDPVPDMEPALGAVGEHPETMSPLRRELEARARAKGAL